MYNKIVSVCSEFIVSDACKWYNDLVRYLKASYESAFTEV